MSLWTLLLIGVIATAILHIAGVFTRSLKLVWIVIVFLWAVVIGTLLHEIKPQGYEAIAKMQGKYEDTDRLIKEAGEEISVYELLKIKQSYEAHRNSLNKKRK